MRGGFLILGALLILMSLAMAPGSKTPAMVAINAAVFFVGLCLCALSFAIVVEDE